MQIATKLQQLFRQYQYAFMHYDMDELQQCYHLPCTLNTPDKILLIKSENDFLQEFDAIFTQLKSAQTSNIVAKQCSFEQISQQLYLVCIAWDFIDGHGEVFADFAAIYHVLDCKHNINEIESSAIRKNTVKIINVVSHELDSALTLSEQLSW